MLEKEGLERASPPWGQRSKLIAAAWAIAIVAKRPTYWGTVLQIRPLSRSPATELYCPAIHCACVALDLYPQLLWTALTAAVTTTMGDGRALQSRLRLLLRAAQQV